MLNRVRLVLISLLIFSNISYAVDGSSAGLELFEVEEAGLVVVSLEPAGDNQNRNNSVETSDLENGLSLSSRPDSSPSSGPTNDNSLQQQAAEDDDCEMYTVCGGGLVGLGLTIYVIILTS